MSRRPKGYMERLRSVDVPLYGQMAYFEPMVRYPFAAVEDSIGRSYFNSSIAYAMALAIHECADEIGIWGVDMDAGDEYFYQRPNMEWLIGLAEGRGIKVHIPESSPLCKFQGEGIRFGNGMPVYRDRYGWLG